MTRVRGQRLNPIVCRQKHLGFSGNLGTFFVSPCCAACVVVFTSSRSPKRNRLGRSVPSPPRIGGDRLLFCCSMETEESQESTNTKASWKKTSSCCKGFQFPVTLPLSLHSTTRRFVAIEEHPSARSSSFDARWCLHDSPPLSHGSRRSEFVFLHPTHVNQHCNYIAAGT